MFRISTEQELENLSRSVTKENTQVLISKFSTQMSPDDLVHSSTLLRNTVFLQFINFFL